MDTKVNIFFSLNNCLLEDLLGLLKTALKYIFCRVNTFLLNGEDLPQNNIYAEGYVGYNLLPHKMLKSA